MDERQFQMYVDADYNRIPVTRKVLTDFDTPLSVYLKLADSPYSFLLESAAQGGERWGRYSIIGLPCDTIIRVRGNRLSISKNGTIVRESETDDPLNEIQLFKRQFQVPQIEGLPRFFGGLVGYFSYDTVRYVEPRMRGGEPPDPLGTPDILLMVSRDLIVFDNVSSQMQVITLADPNESDAWAKANERIDDLVVGLKSAVPMEHYRGASDVTESVPDEGDFESEFGKESFKQAVESIREYIRAGDVMQVVLAQRLSIPFTTSPVQLYRALRSINPSPYMYFMNLDDFHIVSSSPEILARVENGVVTNRPLAGTRRRGRSIEEDEFLERELLNDPKEIAEHLMLIDLGRNDIGKVCKVGSVKVTDKFTIERYSHVMHIASHVIGELADGQTAMDVLKATLPVGTLSGAPKIRAMEIIDELEPVKRGIYGGAVGYIAWNDNMDTAIALRTAVIKDGRLYIEAGGGIVADSIGELEWKESMNKGRAIFHAAGMAVRGLDS